MPPLDAVSLEPLSGTPLGTPLAQLLILLLSGVLYCFVGYRVFKLILVLTGFLVAGGVSASLVSVGFPDSWLVPAGVGLLCGLLGAGVLTFLYRLGVFFVGGAFGALVAFQLMQNAAPPVAGITILLAGLLAGGLALVLERPVLSLALATIGAWLIVASATVLAHGGHQRPFNPDTISPSLAWALLLCWLVLSVFGLMTQYARPKKKLPQHSAR